MSNESLENFVNNIMSINATLPGIGGAYSGIIGTSASGSQTLFQLKKSVMCFASAYRKNDSNKDSLMEMSKAIEGMILTLGSFSVITNQFCNQLQEDLEDLLNNHS